MGCRRALTCVDAAHASSLRAKSLRDNERPIRQKRQWKCLFVPWILRPSHDTKVTVTSVHVFIHMSTGSYRPIARVKMGSSKDCASQNSTCSHSAPRAPPAACWTRWKRPYASDKDMVRASCSLLWVFAQTVSACNTHLTCFPPTMLRGLLWVVLAPPEIRRSFGRFISLTSIPNICISNTKQQ